MPCRTPQTIKTHSSTQKYIVCKFTNKYVLLNKELENNKRGDLHSQYVLSRENHSVNSCWTASHWTVAISCACLWVVAVVGHWGLGIRTRCGRRVDCLDRSREVC